MAHSVELPEPSEKGKTKSTRKPQSLRQSWLRKERSDASWLQKADAPDPDPTIKASVTSTGRLGHLTHLGYDSASATYVGETKVRSLPGWIKEAWIQINQVGLKRGRHPVLFLHLPTTDDQWFVDHEGKKHRVPVMHIITEARHEELLEYERRCLAQSSPASTP